MHLVHWVNNILRDENVYFKFWNELMRVTSNSASDKNLLAMIKKYDINAYFEFWNELSADYDVGHFRFVDTMYNRFFTQSGIQSNNCKKCKCYHVAYACSKCNMKCNDCTQPIIIVKYPSSNPMKKIMIIHIHWAGNMLQMFQLYMFTANQKKHIIKCNLQYYEFP